MLDQEVTQAENTSRIYSRYSDVGKMQGSDQPYHPAACHEVDFDGSLLASF